MVPGFSRSVKIVHFTHPFAPLIGGIESSVATFAADLRALSHEVLVATTSPAAANDPESGILRIPSHPDGVRLFTEVAETGPKGVRLCFEEDAATSIDDEKRKNPDRAGSFYHSIETFAPDVIHVHQPFLLGRWAQEYSLTRGLPLVFTHHTLYDREEDRVHLDGLAALEAAARELAIVYSDFCDGLVAPTPSIAALLRNQGVAGPISVVPTGIDTARFASGDRTEFRQRHGIPADVFVVGHLGRLIPAKRIAYLTEAIVTFLTRAPEAVALICGEGEMAAPLADTFREAGLSDRLFLLGRLSEGEIADAYAAMDVFTFASLTDTQGLVLTEAMAAGVPVLALRATGPQDVVVDGVSGRLLDPVATPADFAHALAAFRDSPDRPRFAAEARRRSLDFDRRVCAEALLSVYEEAVNRRRGRSDHRDPRQEPLAALHDRVAAEWIRLASLPSSLHALLPTRGFPGFDPRG